MNRVNDWSHPLPFGDSLWVKKNDVEPLVKAVRKMLDEIYEFGSVVSNEYVETAESAYIKLVGDEPANKGLQADGKHVHSKNCICVRCLKELEKLAPPRR